MTMVEPWNDPFSSAWLSEYSHGNLQTAQGRRDEPGPERAAMLFTSARWRDALSVCGKCLLPINRGEVGVRHYGLYVAHSEHRCIELLRAQLRTAEEARERAERMARDYEAELERYSTERAKRRADLAAISALFPDNAPHKFPETGVSLLDDVRDALAEVQRLSGQVEELGRDKARLDWLGYTKHGFVRGTDFSKWTLESPEEGIRVLRQAIDAAMGAPGEAGSEREGK